MAVVTGGSDALSPEEIEELAETVTHTAEAAYLLDLIGLPRRRQPIWNTFTSALQFWDEVGRLLANGVIADGPARLREAVRRQYPYHRIFGVSDTSPSPVADPHAVLQPDEVTTEVSAPFGPGSGGGAGPYQPTVNGRRLTGRSVLPALGGLVATMALTGVVTSPVWWAGRAGGVLSPVGVGTAMAMLALAISPPPRWLVWLSGCMTISAVEVAALVVVVTRAFGLSPGVLRTGLEAAFALGISLFVRWISRVPTFSRSAEAEG